MKNWMIFIATLFVASETFAQSAPKADTIKAGNFIIINEVKNTVKKDSGTFISNELNTPNSGDSIVVGNFVIVRKNKTGHNNLSSVNITIDNDTYKINHKRKLSNISTNWFIFDLGFTNFRDNTNYTTAQTMGYLNPVNGALNKNSFALNTGKSSNFNLWFFMQKLNITKHVLNLKYGLGLEMYNFRYDQNISFRDNPDPNVYIDNISFSKNKLFAEYLTVPLMLNVNTTPHRKNGFSFSLGASAGYLIDSRNKQISGERGKQKYHGSFDLQSWRVATITELGLGPVRLYGSYSLNALHQTSTGLDQFPYAVGLRFSNW
jgi:hypothetical protein